MVSDIVTAMVIKSIICTANVKKNSLQKIQLMHGRELCFELEYVKSLHHLVAFNEGPELHERLGFATLEYLDHLSAIKI